MSQQSPILNVTVVDAIDMVGFRETSPSSVELYGGQLEHYEVCVGTDAGRTENAHRSKWH